MSHKQAISSWEVVVYDDCVRFKRVDHGRMSVQELNWLLDGFDLWRNRPHQVLTPRFVT
ncbi:hypothetical protein [Pseudomonas sp. Irchel s3h17]|uniref:hypothetical protein n=1 Tax=Pseudomonas sp. Irchel s3h17 TaxID=2009182 RepID=UPI001570F9B7|nr:hypothetical protein [Pseudomonas sp. Irchel s3h17]